VRHAAENDDVSWSQPIVENPVIVEPGKEHITAAEFQETPREYSVPDTTQNGPEKDSNAVFLTSDEATDERCLVGARVARIWIPQAFVSPFHRPPRKPPPEEIPGPEDVTPTSLTHPLRPPPEPPPYQISCISEMQFCGSRFLVIWPACLLDFHVNSTIHIEHFVFWDWIWYWVFCHAICMLFDFYLWYYG
jgi:hypothetical protein